MNHTEAQKLFDDIDLSVMALNIHNSKVNY
jgi:hypothetical protein